MSMTMAEAHRQISQIREYLCEIGHDGRTEIIAAVEVAMRSMEREMGIMQDMLAGQQITQEEIWRVTEGLRHCSAVGEFCDDCPAHMLCGNGKEQATFLREVLRVLEKLTKILETEAADRVCVRSSNGDLISRSALCGKQEEMYIHTDSGKIIPAMAIPVWVINNAPTVDAAPQWISVHDRLPEDDARYLCYTIDALCEVCIYYGDGEWIAPDFANWTRYVTHWMPLPEPPKEANNE